ncbi:hypothetical protein GGR13_000883 [Brevundimonas variabilis]|uniref:Uncharacterized protein n=1 Tax=Brevundimonas variabilis TaxID=74312 RepID=A0A7W9CGY8_9CAUL|nr:hypothetical protein [Brevundimonas variabilis]
MKLIGKAELESAAAALAKTAHGAYLGRLTH